jgi:hypothetical protein
MNNRSLTLLLAATVAALAVGTGAAYAGPAPLDEPDRSGAATSPGGSDSSGFSFTDWTQLGLVLALTAVVVALIAVVVVRHRHQAPSAI